MNPTDRFFDAQALIKARQRAGLTQSQLARAAGVAGGERVSTWERGLAAPRSPDLIHALARALDVPVDALVPAPVNGPTLRWLRTVAGLSLDELAQAAHVSVPTIKRWERHGTRRGLPQATLTDLAEALDATPDVIADTLRRAAATGQYQNPRTNPSS